MFHAEPLCTNPLTGRRAWLLRHIPDGDYGEPWDASLVIVRSWWGGKTARMMGAENIDQVRLAKEIRGCLAELGFDRATANRHGREKVYQVKTRRGI